MADEEEDKGWLRRQTPRPYKPQSFYPSNRQDVPTNAFKFETVEASYAEVQQKIDDYYRKFAPAAYATELVSQHDNLDGTITLKFRRYPTAE
ncbi:hypothetical protein [Kordiimonas pumila]|uniref:Uncharacterized protein n=1 Tax=Kordiimonas pumila TaxID=2161677 RepID=A0ABV7DA65_9PROT|nr:hypothetical protein [Kordiimonas pumila]